MKVFPGGHQRVVLHLHHVLQRASDHLPATVPPQGNVDGITLIDTQRLFWVRQIQAQATAASNVKEAMVGNPFPHHVLVWWFAVLQGQYRFACLNAFLETLTLDNEYPFI